MPPRPTHIPQQRLQQNNTGIQQQQRYNQLATRQSQQKLRNINEEEETDNQTEAEETIDPESTCYIRDDGGLARYQFHQVSKLYKRKGDRHK